MEPEMDWIKIMCNILDHRKIKMIRKGPEGNTMVLFWLLMLLEAGKCNRGGYLMLADSLPYTDETLSMVTDIPLPTVQLALSVLAKLAMIDHRDGAIYILNWAKYQSEDRLELRREKDRLRKQRQRQKEREKLLLTAPEDMSRDIPGRPSRDVTLKNREDYILEKTTELRKLLLGTAFNAITNDDLRMLLTRHGMEQMTIAADIAAETWRKNGGKEISNPGGYLQSLCQCLVEPPWYRPSKMRMIIENTLGEPAGLNTKANGLYSSAEEEEMLQINDFWSSLTEAEQEKYRSEAMGSMPFGLSGPQVAIIAIAKNIAWERRTQMSNNTFLTGAKSVLKC